LVVCDAPFGPGNLANLRLALDAARAGIRTLMLDQVPIEKRDFTEGLATELWRALAEHAAAFQSTEELLGAAKELSRQAAMPER
jgi:hypothetical protein